MSKSSVKIGRKVLFTYNGIDFNSREEVKAHIAKQSIALHVASLIAKQGIPTELQSVPAEVLSAFVLNLFTAANAKKPAKKSAKVAKVAAAVATPKAAKTPAATKPVKAAPAVTAAGTEPKKRGPKPGSKRKSAVVLPPPPAI